MLLLRAGFGWLGALYVVSPLFLALGGWVAWCCFVAGAMVMQTVSRALKLSIARERPAKDAAPRRRIALYRTPMRGSDAGSFPSGDCGCAAVAAATLRVCGAPVGVCASVVVGACLGRQYYWYHWLGDTVAGSLLGWYRYACACFVPCGLWTPTNESPTCV